MYKNYLLLILIASALFSCGEQRPDGTEVQEFLEHLNTVSKPLPKGKHNEYYSLLSKEFISNFEKEIDNAIKLDSNAVRNLPTMEMLRVLSLKNSFAGIIKQSDTKTVILNWLEAAGKGFPLKNADRFYYAPKVALETKMINEGKTFPQVLITKEGNAYKVNPFNKEGYQEKRIKKIMEKKDLEDLIKESAWLHIQTQRRINWDPI